MKKDRREDVLLVALVISVIVHAVLMCVFRPQVMTKIPGGSHHDDRRPPMRVVTGELPPDPVMIENVQDVEPVRDAPAATAEPSPAMTAGPVPETPASAPMPVILPTELSVPDEVAPHFDTGSISLDPAAPVTIPMTRLSVSGPGESVAPVFAKPMPRVSQGPAFAFSGADSESLFTPRIPEVPARLTAARPATPFKPREEVLDKVDEQVVESEKAAIRELTDSVDTAELEPLVTARMTSAVQGEWRYFRVTLTPTDRLPMVPKDFVVLIDASGSIGRERMRSIRQAAKRLLRSVTNTGDRFNVVTFRDRFVYAYRSWQQCTEPALVETEKAIDHIAAHGRTDVFSTIRSVLTLPRDPKRPLIALVVTDGEANTGITATAEIISRFTELNDGMISMYMYGVKSSANRELIDLITHGSRGEGYIFRGDENHAGEAIDAFSGRFRDPVLTDLRVVFFAGISAEVYPSRLRNLYRGGTVELCGRLPLSARGIGFELKGLNGASPYSGIYRFKFTGKEADDQMAVIRWKEEQGIANRLRKE